MIECVSVYVCISRNRFLTYLIEEKKIVAMCFFKFHWIIKPQRTHETNRVLPNDEEIEFQGWTHTQNCVHNKYKKKEKVEETNPKRGEEREHLRCTIISYDRIANRG